MKKHFLLLFLGFLLPLFVACRSIIFKTEVSVGVFIIVVSSVIIFLLIREGEKL